MRNLRRIAPIVFFLAVLAVIPAGHAIASGEAETAEPVEAEGPPPTVSFADTRALTLEEAKLKQLAATGTGALEVGVHNGLGRAQRVSLEVTGLDEAKDPALAELFPHPLDTHLVPPGQTSSFRLVLANPLPKVKEGSYAVVLLASGRSGGLARRELTITYPPAPGKAEKPGENSLSPDRPIDITLHAVNYLPSLLSSLLGLGLFLAVALLLTAAVFRKWLAGKRPDLPVALLAAAVLVGAVSLAAAVVDGPWDQPSLHAISSRPIALAPQVPSGTLGTVSSEDGTIAQLIASDHELRPQNLDGANKYTGKYNLSGEHEVAEATATVNIRDYWIYAALTIVLGLLIGFLLRRWFQQSRPKMMVKTLLQKAIRNYKGDLTVFEESDKGRPYEATAIDARVRAREGEIKRLIDIGEATKATEKVTALAGYAARFAELREKIRKLDGACNELAAVPRLEILKLELSEANGYQEARRMLQLRVDSPGLDSGEEELKEQLTKVASQTGLIQSTTLSAKSAIRHLLILDKIKKESDGTGNHPEELRTIENELYEAAGKMLQASSITELAEARAGDNTAMRKLAKFVRPVGVEQSGKELRITVEPELVPPSEDGEHAISDTAFIQTAFIPNEPPTPLPTVKISASVETAEKTDDQRIHIDDMVRIEIAFSDGAGASFREVGIEFGDGSQRNLALPPSGQPLFVRHRYTNDSPPTIVVSSVPGGDELARHTIEGIVAEPRPLPSEAEFAGTDKAVNTAAFMLAVASGMTVLYFADPAWGQPMDYLAALVWGGTTGEGVKFAAALADRVWPSS